MSCARSREAGRALPGSSEEGVPPSWGFSKGAGPLLGPLEEWARQASEPSLRRKGGILEQDVDRGAASPLGERCVALACARWSAIRWLARESDTLAGSQLSGRLLSRLQQKRS